MRKSEVPTLSRRNFGSLIFGAVLAAMRVSPVPVLRVVGTGYVNTLRNTPLTLVLFFFAFAGPYFVAGQGLLVREDETAVTGKESLKGKKVCSANGSTPLQRVQRQQLTEPNNIIGFQTYTQCVEQLRNKQVDAVTTDDAILKGYAAQSPEQLKLVGQPFSSEPYGIGLPHDDKALRDKVNDVLQQSFQDGTWQKIYDATLGKSGSPSGPPQLQRY